ncbi:GroES-like protein [Coniochaeta sp. PMI_546]|nr:GroES-like protein [Coniochaeta sp. PMI_546]
MAHLSMQWVLRTTDTLANLEYVSGTIPSDLEDNHVLVEMRAASLNYRDLAIVKGSYPTTRAVPNTVPGSDGSGVVKAVGSGVFSFKPGDKVMIHLVPNALDDSLPRFEDISGGLGQTSDGTLRELAVFPQEGLVRMPENMTFEQAATLPCSGLTAWNALMGLRGREVKAGDYVLVQGTGGVSIAALKVSMRDSNTACMSIRIARRYADVVLRILSLLLLPEQLWSPLPEKRSTQSGLSH